MPHCLTSLVVPALIALYAVALPCADRDLLEGLTAEQAAKIGTKDAAVHYDLRTRALTLTFSHSQGEPEVRIAAADVGWPADWSKFQAVEFTFYANTLEPIAVGFSDGRQTKYFRIEPLPGVRIRGVIPFEAFLQTRTMTPLLPLGYKVWLDRLLSFDRVLEVVFKTRYPGQASQFVLSTFILRNLAPADEILDRKPLMDRYGQWSPGDWENKARDDEHLRRLWAEDRLEPTAYPFCPLGGDPRRKLRATGFFHTAKIAGKWVLVDPHGHAFYSIGMDLVDPSSSSFATDISRREYLFERFPDSGPAWLKPGAVVSFYLDNVMRRFGENWAGKYERHVVARLKNWGFNTIGNWSHAGLAARSRMPYVLPLSGWTTRKAFPFPYDFPDVFSTEFEENVDAAARRQCAPLKDDPHLIGWFIGNEPHWARAFGAPQSWPKMLLSDTEHSATQERLKQMLAADPANADKIKAEFLYTCAKKYFEAVSRAIRKYDPHHLVLGIRFAERPERRWAEMSSVFDAFSINIYSADFAPDPEMIRTYSEVSGKPVLIGEFTACAPGRGLQGLFYFTHKVRDQAERGKAYRYYVENAAASPYVVGTHWFQLVDDLPTGRPSDGERLNYGFLNVIDLPYEDLVSAARETHRRIYDLKFGKTQPFAERPRFN